MDGFEAGTEDLPVPTLELAAEVREKMALAMTAMIHGATPEEIAPYLRDGFPPEVTSALERPGEREEIYAHLDAVLSVIPVGVSA